MPTFLDNLPNEAVKIIRDMLDAEFAIILDEPFHIRHRDPESFRENKALRLEKNRVRQLQSWIKRYYREPCGFITYKHCDEHISRYGAARFDCHNCEREITETRKCMRCVNCVAVMERIRQKYIRMGKVMEEKTCKYYDDSK
jgi:hypothetical protein